MERLQKVLAAAGIGSRRACEELITEGRIEVDKQVVATLGTRVDPDTQEIRFDGQLIRIPRREYYLVNKPPGVVSTNFDQSGRLRVIDLISSKQRVFTVGRLDKSSEGLMIVTNDGELAQQLTHPKFGCQKTYLVTVKGVPTSQELDQLKRGVRLSDGFAKIHDFRIKKRMKSSAVIEIILKEGRNREIRRLLARLDHKVTELRRVAIGPIRLADLPLGAHRRLDAREIRLLRQFSADQSEGKRGKKTTGKKSTGRRTSQTSRSSSTKPAKRTPGKAMPGKQSPGKRKATRTSVSKTTRTGDGPKRKKSASSAGKAAAGRTSTGRTSASKRPAKKKNKRGAETATSRSSKRGEARTVARRKNSAKIAAKKGGSKPSKRGGKKRR